VKGPRGRIRRRWKDNIKMYLKDTVVRCRVDLMGYGTGMVMRFCEYGTELSGSTKFGEFLDSPSNYGALKKDGAAWS